MCSCRWPRPLPAVPCESYPADGHVCAQALITPDVAALLATSCLVGLQDLGYVLHKHHCARLGDMLGREALTRVADCMSIAQLLQWAHNVHLGKLQAAALERLVSRAGSGESVPLEGLHAPVLLGVAQRLLQVVSSMQSKAEGLEERVTKLQVELEDDNDQETW